MNENLTDSSKIQAETTDEISRRKFFEKLSIGLIGVCTAIVGVPLVGFIFAPLFRKPPQKWLTIGKASDFQVGKTVAVTVVDPSPLPWAGVTAKSAVWVRRNTQSEFIVFSANCTHLGCPVRWLPEAELFMCPCHGGVYYSDGAVAAGPPPRPLVRYDVRVTTNGQLEMGSVTVPISTS